MEEEYPFQQTVLKPLDIPITPQPPRTLTLHFLQKLTL